MKKIIRDYIIAYNNFDVPGMIRHLSDDVIFQNISKGEVTLEITGKEAFKKQLNRLRSYSRVGNRRLMTFISWTMLPKLLSIMRAFSLRTYPMVYKSAIRFVFGVNLFLLLREMKLLNFEMRVNQQSISDISYPTFVTRHLFIYQKN